MFTVTSPCHHSLVFEGEPVHQAVQHYTSHSIKAKNRAGMRNFEVMVDRNPCRFTVKFLNGSALACRGKTKDERMTYKTIDPKNECPKLFQDFINFTMEELQRPREKRNV